MRRIVLPLLLVAALVSIAVAGYWLKRAPEASPVRCADPVAGCTLSHRGTLVRVAFSARPSALEAFELRVQGTGVDRASAEFQMVGMDMGFNRYDLRGTGPGAFASTVTLPVCVTDRHDWILYLELDGARYAIPFRTQ